MMTTADSAESGTKGTAKTRAKSSAREDTETTIADEPVAMDDEERSRKADKLIRDHVLAGVATGVIPVPGVDMILSFGTQLNLVRKLSDLYGVPFRKSAAKSCITALLAAVGGVGAGAFIGMSLLKVVPIFGTAMGIVGTSASLGAFTFAVGKVFQQHFESEGNFFDFDAAAYRDDFKELFKRGKEVAEGA